MASTVIDLFSGGGGASAGFHAHPGFKVIAAVDAQLGKPSSGEGKLDCNATYSENIGIHPLEANLAEVSPDSLASQLDISTSPDVLIACPPCTGFSRTLAKNHIEDDKRNSLVGRVSEFVRVFSPKVLIMENARELAMGRFKVHLTNLIDDLEGQKYRTSVGIHFLNDFGLPQRRERTIVIAVRNGLSLRTFNDLWEGLAIEPKSTHVRRAIWALPFIGAGEINGADPMHISPSLRDTTLARLSATPTDGGSWFDLANLHDSDKLLTPTMRSRLALGNLGSHPDVYGRMWWDRPAPTIKRECSHVGNGRYSHPEQNRLCSIREMAILNGFPYDYIFRGTVHNRYRHIGDAVPPVISYQMAALTAWMLGGNRPTADEMIMPRTHLDPSDVISR